MPRVSPWTSLLPGALLPLACASPSPAPASGTPPPGNTAASRSPAGPVATGDAAACAAITQCTACAAQPACRWCTGPRGCTVAGGACAGLLLGHPETCDNDPVERTRLWTEREEARAKGLVAVGPPVVGQLASFPGVDFNIARGLCYAAIVRFGAGARLGDVTLNHRMTTREESAGGMSITQPSGKDAPQNLYCPRSPGKLSVWFDDRWTHARVTNAGVGEVSVQLHTYPITEADLRAGDAKAAALSRKIDSMPADCADCDFNCRSSGTACENRCFRDTQSAGRSARSQCEYQCEQITRACQHACEARCQ